MADGYYLATNIIISVFAIGRIVGALYNFIVAVLNAPKAREDLKKEFYLRNQTVIWLQQHIHKKPLSAELQWFDTREVPLIEYIKELAALQASMEKNKRIDHLKWPIYKEAEVMAEVAKYQRLEAIFVAALTVNQSSLAKAIEADMEQTELASQKTAIGTVVEEAKTTPEQKDP